MPNPLTGYINGMRHRFEFGMADMGLCAYYMQLAGQKLENGLYEEGGTQLIYAAGYLDKCKSHLNDEANYNYKYYEQLAMEWIDDNWPDVEPPPVLDMSSILSAMVVATYEELQYFIGLVDAYRCAIWDQPFNADFYAALARGFRP